jgi:hypothetical protein
MKIRAAYSDIQISSAGVERFRNIPPLNWANELPTRWHEREKKFDIGQFRDLSFVLTKNEEAEREKKAVPCAATFVQLTL